MPKITASDTYTPAHAAAVRVPGTADPRRRVRAASAAVAVTSAAAGAAHAHAAIPTGRLLSAPPRRDPDARAARRFRPALPPALTGQRGKSHANYLPRPRCPVSAGGKAGR